jgi:hypothetical protein
MPAERRLSFLVGVVALAVSLLLSGEARAELTPASRGLAVVAEGETAVFAASLARAVYGDPGLLPPTLDEAHARALAGAPVAPDAPPAIHDLAETRAALHGDDAPTRSLLVSLAGSLHVKGLVIVQVQPGERPAARVFVAAAGAFDPVLYEPDPAPTATWGAGTSIVTWAGTASALHRTFADTLAVAPPAPAPVTAGAAAALSPALSPALAPTPPPIKDEKVPGSRPFYTSPWFWGAIGAAAFAGAAFYFATRDSSAPNIQLQVQVPR